jgi:hypothetical protein
MFTKARPQFVLPEADSGFPISQLFLSTEGKEKDSNASRKTIRGMALAPLKPTGQGKGEAIGFFEQGLLLGGTLLLTTVIPMITYGAWIVGKKGLQALAKR